ncbi:MAG TPA: undecaprenyldiphospho-muramoylpentapeptide beta-N-acetylglucosaminyltransferase [Firmicutes bacterium]|nr:undecaprenyldiphospho-muramoylpentapeptide beta-N-acetylglucosaminyltransferase [Candidatus Fermentithermobacillaceae bacterium]
MRLMVSGGGTGGHIYPGLAVIEFLVDMLPTARILYVGTAEGMEADIVPKHGIDFAPVRSGGIRGKSAVKAVAGAARAALGVKDAFRILKDFRPDVVLGTGGYVSGPVILAAWAHRIPCAIQEQNSVPGKTNLILAGFVQRIFCAWEKTRAHFHDSSKVVVTGNPVRKAVIEAKRDEGYRRFGLDPGKVTVLLLGGSRGAMTLVQAGLKIAERADDLGFQMLFITGNAYFDMVAERLGCRPQAGIKNVKSGNLIVQAYVYDIEYALACADLAVCRAGGMTLAEVTARGIPAVVVPSPNVAGNHQEHNARALEELGACEVVTESRGAGAVAEACLNLLLDRENLARMAAASKAAGRPDAAERIARELIKVARTRH